MAGSEVLGFAGSVVVLDQATKALAVRFVAPAGAARGQPVLELATNARPWLGRTPPLPLLLGLWGLVVACTALVLTAGAATPSHELAGAGLLLALGGATSNLLDRLGRGAVVDFIALGRWPAFNLADVAIVAGVLVAVGSLA